MSKYAHKYPDDVLHTKKHYVMVQRFLNNKIDERFPNIDSYVSKSNWILEFEDSNRTASRIANHTSCPLGDIPCAEVFAFQRLIIGPFYSKHRSDFMRRLQGVDPTFAMKIVNSSWAEAPRFDAAVHFRNQFPHFERNIDANDPKYQEKVQSWLNDIECGILFRMIKDKLTELFTVNTDRSTRMHTNYTVFVAADNEMVKNAFRSYLSTSQGIHFNTVSAASEGIMHYGLCDECRSEQVIRNLSYDWYLLSLSKAFLSWRVGGTSFTSTYLDSAASLADAAHPSNETSGKHMKPKFAVVGHIPNYFWKNFE